MCSVVYMCSDLLMCSVVLLCSFALFKYRPSMDSSIYTLILLPISLMFGAKIYNDF